MFHYLFPPLSIGLGSIMVLIEGMYLKTGDPQYEALARFWTKIFAVVFAMGVVRSFFSPEKTRALLAGRRAFGWRGPKAAGWLYAGAAMLLLGYVGSRFVLEVLLHRSPPIT